MSEKTNQMKRLVSLTLKADIIPLTASEEEKTMRLLWAGAIVNRIIIYLKEGAIDNVNDLAKDCFKYLSKFSLSNK